MRFDRRDLVEPQTVRCHNELQIKQALDGFEINCLHNIFYFSIYLFPRLKCQSFVEPKIYFSREYISFAYFYGLLDSAAILWLTLV